MVKVSSAVVAENAKVPIEVTEAGIVIAVRVVAKRNELLKIEVTPAGIV
jgi:hypothetical protein